MKKQEAEIVGRLIANSQYNAGNIIYISSDDLAVLCQDKNFAAEYAKYKMQEQRELDIRDAFCSLMHQEFGPEWSISRRVTQPDSQRVWAAAVKQVDEREP